MGAFGSGFLQGVGNIVKQKSDQAAAEDQQRRHDEAAVHLAALQSGRLTPDQQKTAWDALQKTYKSQKPMQGLIPKVQHIAGVLSGHPNWGIPQAQGDTTGGQSGATPQDGQAAPQTPPQAGASTMGIAPPPSAASASPATSGDLSAIPAAPLDPLSSPSSPKPMVPPPPNGAAAPAPAATPAQTQPAASKIPPAILGGVQPWEWSAAYPNQQDNISQAISLQKAKFEEEQRENDETTKSIETALGRPMTSEEKLGRYGIKPSTTVENWTTFDAKFPDGTTATLQRNTKDGTITDLNKKPVDLDKLSGASIIPKTIKGLAFDTATGQVVNKDTGKRYSPGDITNPPEIAAMFKQQSDMQSKKEAFQAKMAATRGATYNATRPLDVYDSANGNSPTYATFAQMQANPGRYIPVGPGAKAIASENLIQDIVATSQLTRGAINKLKEDFPDDMKVKIALAMRADDPHAALDQLIASGSLGSLAPDQQDVLITTRQLAENAMALRTLLGAGQGSDDVRTAIRETLPGLLSPDRSYALRQLDAFDKTIARLHRGVPNVKLRTDIDTSGGAKIRARDPQGKLHEAPAGTPLPKGWTLDNAQ